MLLENYSEKYRTAVSDYYAEFSENGEDVREDVCGGPSLTFLYIREKDGRLVGMLNIRKGEEAERIGTFGYAIRPSERRKGYGRMLVESALELCEMMEIEDPVLYVNKDNVAGLRLLESLGFCEARASIETDNIIKFLISEK